MPSSAHTTPWPSGIGQRMNEQQDPVERQRGRHARQVGRAWLRTGAASASASRHASVPSASARGGNTAARLMRWMWNHSPNTSNSGTPMCTKTNSENSRSLTAATLRKLRVSGAASSGSASIHSAVACAEN